MSASSPSTDTLLRLLLIEASEEDAVKLLDVLRASGIVVHAQRVASTVALRTALRGQTWDAVLCRLHLPSLSAQTAFRVIQSLELDLPFVLIADDLNDPAVSKLMRNGAHDCFSLLQPERLLLALEREIRYAHHRADHRAALEMLRISEARFRALASNLPGMVFQLQRNASHDLRFIYVSEGCNKLLGLKPHELLAAPHRFMEAIHPADRPALDHALAESASTCNMLNWEGRIRKRGKIKWINLRSTPQKMAPDTLQWQGIATDISLSKEGEAKLRHSREQLSELSDHLESAKEEERERIARDVHDELGGTLAVIKIETALLTAKLPSEFQELHAKARAIENMLDQAMNTVSRVARELRPGILKEFGLSAAIECQADDFTQRTGIVCRAHCDEDEGAIDPHVSLALFRIFQEALTNVAKHAQATRVTVNLRRKRHHVILEIRDNGKGISQADLNKPKSFGLRGIRERINHLNGEFTLGAAEQGGCLIILSVPVARRNLPTPASEQPDDSLQRNLF